MSDQPRQPVFERKISVGNVLTVFMIIAATFSTWYALTGRVDLIESALAERSHDIHRLEENATKNDSGIRNIEGRLIRIETQLEQILLVLKGDD